MPAEPALLRAQVPLRRSLFSSSMYDPVYENGETERCAWHATNPRLWPRPRPRSTRIGAFQRETSSSRQASRLGENILLPAKARNSVTQWGPVPFIYGPLAPLVWRLPRRLRRRSPLQGVEDSAMRGIIDGIRKLENNERLRRLSANGKQIRFDAHAVLIEARSLSSRPKHRGKSQKRQRALFPRERPDD